MSDLERALTEFEKTWLTSPSTSEIELRARNIIRHIYFDLTIEEHVDIVRQIIAGRKV